MRITNVLGNIRRCFLPKGNLFVGKDKLIKRVTGPLIRRQKGFLEIEERNMLLLRFPYLTKAQSSGHAKELGKHDAMKAKWMKITRSEFKNNITLADRLYHLRSNESWD